MRKEEAIPPKADMASVAQVCRGLGKQAQDAGRFLAGLYGTVPRTACTGCGRCCTLTEEEFDAGYVTMFPLYAVEYLHIVQYVRTAFPEARQEALFGSTEEHPRRCPFRDDQQQACAVYPVRPLICRAYGVLSEEHIRTALARHAEEVPASWLQAFAQMERSIACAHVQVLEPGLLAGYLARRARFVYAAQLADRSRRVRLLDGERQRAFEELTGVVRITRWTWGGYNRIVFAPLEWMRGELADQWPSFELVRKAAERRS